MRSIQKLLSGCILLTLASVAAATEVFDVHVHLWEGEESLQAYLAQPLPEGAEIIGAAAMPGGNRFARQGDIERTRQINDAIIELAGRHTRMVPVVTVHPLDGEDALTELERVARLGARAVKLHPLGQRFDPGDARLLDVSRKAGSLSMVVILDNAALTPGENQHYFSLAIAAPETQFVFAHLGGMSFRFWNVLALARTAEGLDFDNVHFDLSGTLLLAAESPLTEEFVWTLRNVGIDKVLIASDYPQFSLADTLAAIEALDLTPRERRKILADNARRLFLAHGDEPDAGEK